ncbi:hypothetical protein [Photorhabdus heterorhabditis]|uniref:Uncharacterized protein n=1 Tax=Photorhabdus heterorhabditis TaxID=880156 RepID=A0A5B0WID0_9GAMM|nr:hypothetical protein [Photorhabdus heterorhabditis]KAA1186743.1 hypothetical protein F0L16_13755 [Photorhabdus heterorhabditis]
MLTSRLTMLHLLCESTNAQREVVIINLISSINEWNNPASTLAEKPQNFLYTLSDNLHQLRPLQERQDIDGMQIIYNWKQLESASRKYDFSAIEKDLMPLSKIKKKRVVQIQNRFLEKKEGKAQGYGLLFSGIHRVAQTLPEFAFCASKRV